MRFRIEKSDIIQRIQLLSLVVPTKNTMPILTNYRVEADEAENRIVITVTDLELTVIESFSANVFESGITLVPAKEFNEIVNAMPDGVITVEEIEEVISIHCGEVRFNIKSAEEHLFPITPSNMDLDTIDIDAQIFQRMVKNTHFSVAQESNRPVFRGIVWRITPEFQLMASSDGKRISETKIEKGIQLEEEFEIILFPKAFLFVSKIINESENTIKVKLINNKAVFFYKDYVVIANSIGNRYPRYDKAFQLVNENVLRINRQDLLNAVKRVSLLLNDDIPRIKMEIDNSQITIISMNREMGDGKEVLKTFNYSGEPVQLALNHRFILSVLAVLESDEILVYPGTGKSAVILENSEDVTQYKSRFVLMPLSVS
ncbi:MAG: DNA polymerase III subunit beta [Candidatus Cloacimonetes bacterium]|nr:DNA polymerase III subunit beta [Candidatus Cloacimonadota bacterium]